MALGSPAGKKRCRDLSRSASVLVVVVVARALLRVRVIDIVDALGAGKPRDFEENSTLAFKGRSEAALRRRDYGGGKKKAGETVALMDNAAASSLGEDANVP